MSLSDPDQPTRNRSVSTGDSGLPQHEHKRPRLSESQPSEVSVVTSPGQPDQVVRSSNSNYAISALTTPPRSPPPPSGPSTTTSPTSKMTINTRPLSSQSIQNPTTALTGNMSNEGQLASKSGLESNDAVNVSTKQESTQNDSHETISISSSDAGSPPPIQIAAPEDLDQDPNETQWQPMPGRRASDSIPSGPDYIHLTFPLAQTYLSGSSHRVLVGIYNQLSQGTGDDGRLFQRIKSWLVNFVNKVSVIDRPMLEVESEFWVQFPQIAAGLIRREVEPPPGAQITDLVEFFVAFARMTKLIIDSDIQRFRTLPDTIDNRQIPAILTPGWLQCVLWSLNPDRIPLYTAIRSAFNQSPLVIVDSITDALLDSGAVDLLDAIADLFDVLTAALPKFSGILETVFTLLHSAQRLIQSFALRAAALDMPFSRSEVIKENVKAAVSQFLIKADAALERAIVKQHTWLTIESAENSLMRFEALIKSFVQVVPQLSSEIVAAAGVDPSIFDVDDLPALSLPAWKFMTLRKFVKNGRMELRVFGIGAMAEDLVNVFKEHLQTPKNGHDHPMVRLMTRFIRDNELIPYIIGVDSHPQIIHRSANVIGFLCVSRSYGKEDTDIIWQTVLESQDPRSGVEVLQVLAHNFENLDISSLLYLNQKLLDLPFIRFSQHIVDFAFKVLRITTWKSTILPNINDLHVMNASTTKLCMKLLREANSPAMCTSELTNRIKQCIPDLLASKLRLAGTDTNLAISRDDLCLIIQELCIDVQDHNMYAGGSTLALGRILENLDEQLANHVIRHYDLTRLIIEDTVIALTTVQQSVDSKVLWAQSDCRLVSLPLLILQAPGSFEKDLVESIWSDLLTSADVSFDIRMQIWSALARVCELCVVRNVVLDTIIDQYLPRLPPSSYDAAILEFVQQSVRYETRLDPPELHDTGGIIKIPGLERVWRIMLGARPNTVEVQASDFIMHEYLDSASIVRLPLQFAEATHLLLIDRCVQQAIDAANMLKNSADSQEIEDPAVDNMEGSEAVKMQFHRSLFFLRKFLDALKARPRFSPVNRRDIREILSSFKPTGEQFELTVQIHSHRLLDSQPQKWEVGLDNTANDLWQFLSEITGWTQFNVIYGGRRVDYKDNTASLREMNIVPGMLMISKTPGSTENAPSRAVRATSPVDNKVMHHFDDLYSLLDLQNDLASGVYDFLTMFSSQAGVLDKLRSMSISGDELLPVSRPYKLKYYSRALRSCIEDESFSNNPNTEFLVYAVQTIVSTLTRINDLQADFEVRLSITHGLIEALTLAFRANVPISISRSYITEPSVFMEQILLLWSQAQEVKQPIPGLPSPASLIRTPFDAIIEALLHDDRLWSHIKPQLFSRTIFQSLLGHPAQEVRQAILEVFYSLTGISSTKSMLKLNDPRSPRTRFSISTIQLCLSRIWESLSSLVITACEQPQICQEFFDAAVSILQYLGKKIDEMQIAGYVLEWKPILFKHKHRQEVGHPLKDFVILSIGKLLLECFKQYPEIGDHFSKNGVFVQEIFSVLLFPPLSDGLYSNNDEKVPILDMQVRQVLYELVLALSRTSFGLRATVEELDSDLVPKDYYFQPYLSNDRQLLRSEVGYAGLRNLSNTCYLNSLFTQLFMNPEFRDLVLNMRIVDQSKQKLLVELAKVFAHMQNTFEDAISPETAVDAITQWDGDQIDVTVQMDVDEFFNLLFDRLEFQILDTEVRSHFKSIYGGQLVQQIKSKECEHVSERLEPFSAVQVEIKGKSGLEESLHTYVQGEVLQGENKYSCTGCGKHVDAVKRACLKDVPDNLIFNLKRFDYDIMTGMRCKVNDEFQFPDTLDMAPYTLEALSNPDSPVTPDMFELVGVIIHSGTAESGHYYSYVRQRPHLHVNNKPWVQFNDNDVTRFDPASIRDCCFGGFDYSVLQCPKFYNGYMLFYQRASSITRMGERYQQPDPQSPIRLPLSDDVESNIAQQNELYLRSHVAQDPVHAKFIKQLLQQMKSDDDDCASDHKVESQLLVMALDYVNQVSARWKELPEVDETLKTLETYAGKCATCAQEICIWLSQSGNLSDNVVRSCYPSVRKAFTHLICTCWRVLADNKEQDQLGNNSTTEDSRTQSAYEYLLTDFVLAMTKCWDSLQRYGRAWEPFFSILSFLTNLGDAEAQIVIDEGLLERSLELIHVHVPQLGVLKNLKPKYVIYLGQRERNRPYGHSSLIQFVADVLPHVALDAPNEDPQFRTQVGDKFGPLNNEAHLLGLISRQPLSWLRKVIIGGFNVPAVDVMVAYMSKIRKLNSLLAQCLRDGLGDSNILYAVSFLRPTLTYLRTGVALAPLLSTVENALELIESTGGSYGKEFLTFVQEIGRLENRDLDLVMGGLCPQVYHTMKNWAPVLLMHPNDIHSDVRGDTVEYLTEMLFAPLDEAKTGDLAKYDSLLTIVLELVEACSKFATRAFLDPNSKDKMTLQAGQANQVLHIVDSCLPLFTNNAAEEERAARVATVMDELRLRADGIIETVSNTDWKDASSDLEPLSEVDLSELST